MSLVLRLTANPYFLLGEAMNYETKRSSKLYIRKNIEYIFLQRIKPSTIIDDKYHRVISILGRGWYLYNEDTGIFLLMFGTHYSDELIDSWIKEYGVSIGLSPTIFESVPKKHWYKYLFDKDNHKQKLEKLVTRQRFKKPSSTQYKDLEFLIQDCISRMLEVQATIVSNDTIYEYRKKASFYLYPEILPLVKGYNRLCKYGKYSIDNKTGMTLDHRVSIKFGYENNIPPYILAHPANCEFLSMKENSSKNKNCSISYDQLLQYIDLWNRQLITAC
jgi:hypothetical protein